MKSDDMKTPKERWLEEYTKETTKARYVKDFDDFCRWAQTSDVELVEHYKASDDRQKWAKDMGALVAKFYNSQLEQGFSINFSRSKISAIRAFLKSQCEPVRIRRGAIAKPQISIGEHEFRQDELRRMFHFGDVREKAILSTAVSLGWSSDDFLNLKRDFIAPFLDKEPFTGFWATRRKTGEPVRTHLTPEAIDSLRAWLKVAPKSKYVFATNSKGHLSNDRLNEILKEMVENAGVSVTGRVRFHSIRKFTYSQLNASGMNRLEANLCIGKSIPPDILTYLKDMTRELKQKFEVAYEKLSLVGYQNQNKDRIRQLEQQVADLRSLLFAILGIDAKRLNELLENRKISRDAFERIKHMLETMP